MVLVEMLNLCRAAYEHTLNQDTANGIVRLAKLIQRTRKDRRKYRLLIQPDSIGTADRFLSNQYASDIVARLYASEQRETSHLSDRFDGFGEDSIEYLRGPSSLVQPPPL
jgi:hypothetical protein